MLKRQQLGKRTALVSKHYMVFDQHLRNSRFMHLTHKQLDHLKLSFYFFSAQRQRSALYFNPQQQSIIVTYFYVTSYEYGATENTFFAKVYFSSIEYVFPSSQDFVLNLLCSLVYFLSRTIVTFNSLYPEQHFPLKARATCISRKQYYSSLSCSQSPLLLAHTIGSLMWTNVNNRRFFKL